MLIYVFILNCNISNNIIYNKLQDLINIGIKSNGLGKKPFSENLTLLITMELLYIFHHLHEAQIIHADVKSDNIMIKRYAV